MSNTSAGRSKWPYVPLTTVAEKIQDGTHFSPLSTSGPFRYVTSRNIRPGYLDLESCGWISEREHKAIFRRCDPRYGDILLTKDGANTGNASINTLHEEISLLSSVAMIRTDPTVADGHFVLQYLLSPEGQTRLTDLVSGNAITRLTLAKIKAFSIPSAPLPEQRAIAAVLDSLDDAIQKTEQIIAKLQQVKQGLLHDLLTRGIDDNGELRDPERHPEQFQDSPLGRIPKGWEVVRLRDEIRIEHGFAFPGTGFVDEPRGPVLLTPGNFHRDGGLYFERSNTKHFIGSVPVGYVLRAGDIVTVMTDLSPRTLILGRTEVVGTERTLLHNQRIGKVVPLRVGRWTNNLLAMAMSQPPIRGRVVREATGTTVRHTSPDRILACCIARPGMAEQEVILQVMAAEMVREAIELETHRRLVALRAGLSEDLLTGRVRTTSLPGFSA